MAVYLVQGKLGTGKSKFCVWIAKVALYYGRRVAGNLDIHPHLLQPKYPKGYVRVPDKPTAFDLDAIGHGNPDSYDETRNGVLILDELGTWLNSRSFQDKSRSHMIDWLIHARKKGWDVYLIVQDAMMIDKQVREALVEYTATCMRMDKVKIPFVGWMLNSLGEAINDTLGIRRPSTWGYLPFFHLVVARIGVGTQQVVAERWSYTGRDLHEAYDTRQIFRTDYEHGAFSVLPPWDYVPRLSWLSRRFAAGRALLVPRQLSKPRPLPKLRALSLIAQLPDPEQRTRLARRYLEKQTASPRLAHL
jgi:hypothetical protein